ncbi:MAG TPA: BrnT family toxin [Longimicrobium sp.]
MTDPPAGFDWDPAASERCEDEHGFSFFDLVHVFSDERYDYLDLGEHERGGEARRVLIGRMPWGLIVAVVYTAREGVRRLIWVRPARRGERKAFNEHNGLSDERPRVRGEPPA